MPEPLPMEDAPEPEPAFPVQAQAAPSVSAPVRVRDGSGALWEVPSSELGALPPGAAPVDSAADAEAEKHGLGAAYSDYAKHASVGTNAAIHGFTGGLGNAAIYKGLGLLGHVEAADAYKRLYEEGKVEHPIENAISNVGGMVAGGIALGGLGIGGQASRGAMGLLGNNVAGRIAGHAAEAVLQQSAFNVAEQISEDTLGDHAMTGEKFFAASTKDILFAGAAGSVLGGLGEAWKALRPSQAGILESVERARGPVPGKYADQVSGYAGGGKGLTDETRAASTFVDEAARAGVPNAEAGKLWSDLGAATMDSGSVGGDAARAVADAHATWAANGDPALAEVIQRGAANRSLRQAEQAAIMDGHARAFKSTTDDALRNVSDTLDEAQFTFKPEQVKRIIPVDNVAEQIDEGLRIRQRIGEVVDFWEGQAAKGGASGNLKTLSKQLKDFDVANRILEIPTSEAGRRELAAANYLRLDGLRKSVAPLASFGKPKFGLPEIVGHSTEGGDVLYHQIQQSLQNEGIFGKMGEAQAGTNAAFSNSFTVRRKFLGKFTDALTQEMGRPVLTADSGPIKSFLNSVGGSEGDTSREIVQGFIDGERNRLSAIRTHYEITPAQAAKLTKGEQDLAKMEKAVNGAMSEAAIQNKIKLQLAEEAGRSVGGGMLGSAIDLVRNPLKLQALLQDGAQIIDRVSRHGKNAVASVMDWTGTSTKGSAYRGRVPDRAAVAAEIAGIKDAASKPEVMAGRLPSFIGAGLQRAAPKAAAATAATAARAISYLASQAPTGNAPQGILAGHRPIRYSDADVSRWQRTTDAVKDPNGTIADAKHGALSREGVKAIQFVYPQMFEELRSYATNQIAEMSRKGLLDAMPYEQKLMISVLLNIPADDTMRPQFIAAMQATKTHEPPPKPGGGPAKQGGGRRPMKLDTSIFETGAQAHEGK